MANLTWMVGRPVLDQAGLTGRYDVAHHGVIPVENFETSIDAVVIDGGLRVCALVQ